MLTFWSRTSGKENPFYFCKGLYTYYLWREKFDIIAFAKHVAKNNWIPACCFFSVLTLLSSIWSSSICFLRLVHNVCCSESSSLRDPSDNQTIIKAVRGQLDGEGRYRQCTWKQYNQAVGSVHETLYLATRFAASVSARVHHVNLSLLSLPRFVFPACETDVGSWKSH